MGQEIVTSLIRAIENNNREKILKHFHDDAIFHNIPMGEAKGHEAIWGAFAPIHDICGDIEWVVHHIIDNGEGVVMTERTDRYQVNGKWCEFRVMGIFETDEGKVRHWRDYFDMQQILDQLAAV
jgi:limonene-1,2-epoxide hydrolase